MMRRVGWWSGAVLVGINFVFAMVSLYFHQWFSAILSAIAGTSLWFVLRMDSKS